MPPGKNCICNPFGSFRRHGPTFIHFDPISRAAAISPRFSPPTLELFDLDANIELLPSLTRSGRSLTNRQATRKRIKRPSLAGRSSREKPFKVDYLTAMTTDKSAHKTLELGPRCCNPLRSSLRALSLWRLLFQPVIEGKKLTADAPVARRGALLKRQKDFQYQVMNKKPDVVK